MKLSSIIGPDGRDYVDTPRIQRLIGRARAILERLPPIPDGYTRLFRGNRPGEEGQNPSYTNSLVGIALPFLDAYGGKLTYVDVPNRDLQRYLITLGAAPDSEFMLPPELLKHAKVANL